MNIESKELKEYIKSSISAIKGVSKESQIIET